VKCLGVDLVTGFEQDHCELVGLEQGVEFLGQVDGMTRIRETDLLVVGTRITHQDVVSFEIDGFTVKKHCPDTFATEYLITLVGRFVDMFNDYSWLWSRHC
jgi:hypothetical protein